MTLTQRWRHWMMMRAARRQHGVLWMLIAIAAVAGLFGVFASCQPSQKPISSPPVETAGVPLVRVLLAGPVTSAASGTTNGYTLHADDVPVRRAPTDTWKLNVRRDGRRWWVNAQPVTARQLTLSSGSNGLVTFNDIAYRGVLHYVPDASDPAAFYVVNVVDMENYLAGVLAKELYAYWSPETYRTLAVAARTFAMYHLRRTSGDAIYDVTNDQSAQVYGGASAETEKSCTAVRETRGIVLAYGPEGRERIFLAQYSSCCGGRVNPASVLRYAPDIPPLAGGQVCANCANAPRYRWPTVRVSSDRVRAALAAAYPNADRLSDITSVTADEVTEWGRPIWLKIGDSAGHAIRLRADDLRIVLLRSGAVTGTSLPSMNCDVRVDGRELVFENGRGFGHGVGLCQWGAEGMARRGCSAEEILMFYYPGAKFFRAY